MMEEAYVSLEDGKVFDFDTSCTEHCPSCGGVLDFHQDGDPDYPELFAECCEERWMLQIVTVRVRHLRPEGVEWPTASRVLTKNGVAA
jgi:hypothetical protein